MPVFGYKNHVGIDREHGFLRRYSVTHAAAHDGGQLAAVLDHDNTASDVWADTAYRSAANLTVLERCGLKPQFQRKKPRGRKMPAHIARGNTTAPACARASSTSSPPRNAGSGSSSAPSAWSAPASRSAWPISLTTSPGWPGSMAELRPHDAKARHHRPKSGENRLAADPFNPTTATVDPNTHHSPNWRPKHPTKSGYSSCPTLCAVGAKDRDCRGDGSGRQEPGRNPAHQCRRSRPHT